MSENSTLPSSYASLPFKEIALSHVPASSPTVTKVIVITFNRPRRHNAVTESMLREILKAYELISIDDRVRAVVITGAGKSFCVGLDLGADLASLAEKKKDEAFTQQWRDPGGLVALAIYNCPKPTIMAVNGAAAGFGMTVTLSGTIRVASKTAKVSFPFSRRGLTMESCSSFFLPRLIGFSKATHVLVTGESYSVSDPLVDGLFSKILDTPEETVEYALKLATNLAEETSLVSTKLLRDLIFHAPGTAEEAFVLESNIFLSMIGSKDNVEGIMSYMEKRKPQFKGSLARDAPKAWPWWTTKGDGSKL